MPGVFINYRRDDTAGYAGRLYEALSRHFAKKYVFMDIDTIKAGADFERVLDERIRASNVMVTIIGRNWLRSTDERGRRRLDDSADYVRREIALAFARHLPVIPVLVGGAVMPRAEDLPADLKALATRNAFFIYDQLYQQSVRKLIRSLREMIPVTDIPPVPARRAVIASVGAFAAVTVIGSIVEMRTGGSHRTATQESSPPPPLNRGLLKKTAPPPVKVRQLGQISEPPPIVESARNPVPFGSTLDVLGPRNPHAVWALEVTIGDAWHTIGFAPDGTVYLFDDEHDVIAAVRDGKEQWAYNVRGSSGGWTLAEDGRLWLGNCCLNRDGQGGYLRNTRGPRARPNASAALSRTGHCEQLNTQLDGNCNFASPLSGDPSGHIYAVTDAGTVYCFYPKGALDWMYKPESPLSGDPAFAAGNLVLPTRAGLYAIRPTAVVISGQMEVKTIWKYSVEGSTDVSWSNILVDKAGTVFVRYETTGTDGLIAIDRTGKPIWNLAMQLGWGLNPAGLDGKGRLYATGDGALVCLSDA